ncbi:mycothiol synthase [Nocardioides ferulae]|uniref:mycothiol synthase n=1 Tax=Nocardioides ferulae TaxID=2340821 RepID=UPI000EB4942D|nr:mycothiol synthase [Nocardioides ferulae]
MDVTEVEPAEWGAANGPATVVEAVRRACVAADGHDPLDEAAALHLKHRGLAGARLWLVGDAGFALRHGAAGAPAVDLAVTPRARGRGLGRALAAAALAGEGPLSAWSHGDHPAAARLAAAYRMERARELWVMRRDAATPLAEVAADPALEVRAFRAGDAADTAELLRVNAAAFATHPEQGAMDAANLAERMAEEWFDPAGLLVAMERRAGSDRADGGGAGGRERMLGFHWTKQHSPELGEVYVVGIDPAAQGRGLGRVLTAAGLAHLARAGVREVLLYVEADNAPAVRLYSGLGFTHAPADTHAQYRR